jgi:hypothetical protein
MGMKIQAVGIRMPDPLRLFTASSDGGIDFGRHYGELEEVSSSPLRFTSTCDGSLELIAVGGDCIRGRSEEPIEVRCTVCEFNFYAGAYLRDAVFEWMRIALGFSLWQTLTTKYSSYRDMFWREVTVCRPRLVEVRGDSGELEGFLGEDSGFKNLKYFPVWVDHGNEGLLVDALLLMTELERVLHGGIKQGANSACSASEVFHTQTRRPRR